MSWMSNFTLILRSNLTTLQEKFENPERMLHQLLADMEEELERIRASVAEAIVDEIRLTKAVDRARAEAASWSARARSSLERADERSAKAALEQKVNTEARAADLEKEEVKQKTETAKLQASVQDLEDKIRQARQRKTLLLAKLARADSGERIQRALERADSKSSFTQFARLEERVERAEARSEAHARLDGKDPLAMDLERQFREKEKAQAIEDELEALRREVEGAD